MATRPEIYLLEPTVSGVAACGLSARKRRRITLVIGRLFRPNVLVLNGERSIMCSHLAIVCAGDRVLRFVCPLLKHCRARPKFHRVGHRLLRIRQSPTHPQYGHSGLPRESNPRDYLTELHPPAPTYNGGTRLSLMVVPRRSTECVAIPL
jgi:hypothetical protein